MGMAPFDSASEVPARHEPLGGSGHLRYADRVNFQLKNASDDFPLQRRLPCVRTSEWSSCCSCWVASSGSSNTVEGGCKDGHLAALR